MHPANRIVHVPKWSKLPIAATLRVKQSFPIKKPISPEGRYSSGRPENGVANEKCSLDETSVFS
ncbi:MAG: hypothetical protein JW829_02055 [Pirellulales bacterium]|nr:hypothetical protein [Pirellulales bacterium]